MPPDWVQAHIEGQQHSDGSCTKLPLGVGSAREKKGKLPAPLNAQREMRCTLFTAYTACYV